MTVQTSPGSFTLRHFVAQNSSQHRAAAVRRQPRAGWAIISALSFITGFLPSAYAATWYVDGSLAEPGDGRSWETALLKIQEGIDAASDGDTVIVAEGVYPERISFSSENILLRATEPADPVVVQNTVLEAGGFGPVVTFSGAETEMCVLRGFTIRGGDSRNHIYAGAGIRGHGTHATIENNIITGNEHWSAGGGIAQCHGLVQNNTIIGNFAGYGTLSEGYGGGLYDCDGTIRNNIIAGNFVDAASGGPDPYYYPGQGGGLAYCDGTIERNLICNNRVDGEGGGLHSCSGIIRNNIIASNRAGDGAGLFACQGTIENNTVSANNGVYLGGGLAYCEGTIRNCIVWGNLRKGAVQVYDSSVPAYSCIQDWTGGGEGNISEDPRFVDEEKGDFRLRADSPCIDAGFNDPDLPESDIVGMHRVMFGGKSFTVDMGAYEFYINKLDPVPGTDETIFTWSSLANKTYSIFYTDDLLNWDLAIENFPSSGNQTTSWLDDGSLTGLPPLLAPKRFYRLLENP
ncbi:MAG: right-handed parallel beta-helix repeat-containing protein [bacterium]|nr:right-handed parallel beta-helix repeat-containing protein [bacterium]